MSPFGLHITSGLCMTPICLAPWSADRAGTLALRTVCPPTQRTCHCRSFLDMVMGESHRRLPENMSFAAWFRHNELQQRGNAYLRNENEPIANRFPLLFERYPVWRGLDYLNGFQAHADFKAALFTGVAGRHGRSTNLFDMCLTCSNSERSDWRARTNAKVARYLLRRVYKGHTF